MNTDQGISVAREKTLFLHICHQSSLLLCLQGIVHCKRSISKSGLYFFHKREVQEMHITVQDGFQQSRFSAKLRLSPVEECKKDNTVYGFESIY